MRPVADNAGVTLVADISAVTVDGDPQQLEQAILNLLKNGITYNRPGGSVRVTANTTDETACLSIRDTGIGINSEDLSRVTERFYRVDMARSRQLGGSGLGLSIARQIIEAHRGTLGISSVAGEGTKVLIQFPCPPPKLELMFPRMIESRSIPRRYINDHTERIKRIFRWGVSEELAPPSVYQALASVPAIRKDAPRPERPPCLQISWLMPRFPSNEAIRGVNATLRSENLALHYSGAIHDLLVTRRDAAFEGMLKWGKLTKRPIDASGEVKGSGDPSIDGDGENAVGMMHRLGKSDRARQSFVRHLFRYFMGRNDRLSDSRVLPPRGG